MKAWKKSDKTVKTKLKFKTQQEMKEFSDDLTVLNNLEIVDYKIMNEKGVNIGFTKKFVDYYNKYRDALQITSLHNMVGMIRQFPEDFEFKDKTKEEERTYNIEQFISMFYRTLVISYLNDTGLIIKVQNDMDKLTRLIITVEHVRDMVSEGDKGEK